MTDVSDFFSGRLKGKLPKATTTGVQITVNSINEAPVQVPTGEFFAFFKRQTDNLTVVEKVKVAAGSTQNGSVVTLGTLTRGISLTDGSDSVGSPTRAEDHASGTLFYIGPNIHDVEGVGRTALVNTWTARNNFTGGTQVPVFANNTARDAAFPTPWVGLTVVSGVQLQAYFNSTWNVLGTATVSSATESIEGTAELATLAEHDPATTGPRVVQARNTRKTSTGALEGQVVALNASAQVDLTLIPSIPVSKMSFTGTPSATTFARGDGTWATPATSTQVALLQTTRSTTASSGTVSIAHGLGTVPNLVKAEMRVRGAGVSSGDIGAYSSSGQSNGTINQCVVIFENNNGGTTFAVENDSTRAIAYVEDSGAYPSSITDGQTATITFDATNVNLNWTLTGAPTAATMYIMLTVFKF